MELHRASIRSSAVHPSVVASTREEEEEEEEGALTFGWFRRSVGFLEFTSGMHCGTLTTSPEARISSVSVSLASFIISCSCTQPQDHMEPGQHHGTVLCAACGVQHAMGWPHTQRDAAQKREGGREVSCCSTMGGCVNMDGRDTGAAPGNQRDECDQMLY